MILSPRWRISTQIGNWKKSAFRTWRAILSKTALRSNWAWTCSQKIGIQVSSGYVVFIFNSSLYSNVLSTAMRQPISLQNSFSRGPLLLPPTSVLYVHFVRSSSFLLVLTWSHKTCLRVEIPFYSWDLSCNSNSPSRRNIADSRIRVDLCPECIRAAQKFDGHILFPWPHLSSISGWTMSGFRKIPGLKYLPPWIRQSIWRFPRIHPLWLWTSISASRSVDNLVYFLPIVSI